MNKQEREERLDRLRAAARIRRALRNYPRDYGYHKKALIEMAICCLKSSTFFTEQANFVLWLAQEEYKEHERNSKLIYAVKSLYALCNYE